MGTATFSCFGLARLAHMHALYQYKFLVFRFPLRVVLYFFEGNHATLDVVYTEEISADFHAPAELVTHKMLQVLPGKHRKLVDRHLLFVIPSEVDVGA